MPAPAAQGGGGITVVQSTWIVQPGSSDSLAFGFTNAVTGGNLVLAGCVDGGENYDANFSDNKGNVYRRSPAFEFDTSLEVALMYSSGVVGGSNFLITSDPNGASVQQLCWALEISGVAADNTVLESTAAARGNATDVKTGSRSSAGAAIFIAFETHSTGGSPTITKDSADWTLVFESEESSATWPGSLIYRIVATGTTDQGDWTIGSAVNYYCEMLIFK